MTIINPHNMQRLYLVWVLLLLLVGGIGAAQFFYLQSFPGVLMERSFFTSTLVTVIVGVVALVMAIWFKYFFRREKIAWGFLVLLALAGIVMTGLTGWEWYWLSFPVTAFAFLLILGPYLHFE